MHWKMENQWQVFRVRLVLPLVLHKDHTMGGQRGSLVSRGCCFRLQGERQ